MRRSFVTLMLLALLMAGAAVAFHTHDARAQAPPAGQGAPPQGQGAPPGQGGDRGRGGPMRPFVWNKAHADSQVAGMLEHIKGKEDMPVESVYKNIKILNGMAAKRLAPMMVMNFGRSTGMGCGGCHVRDDFSSDDKANKRIARQMFAMTLDLNKKYLSDMKDLQDDMPVINCWTCHRGHHEPESDADHPNTPDQDQPKPESAH